MRGLFYILFLFLVTFSNAQISNEYLAIDKKMETIPDSLTVSTSGIANFITTNFTTESEKIRAAFYWTAANISYDVVNRNEPNFVYTPQEKIAYSLKNRKGVCINYAEVFNEISTKIGIKTVIILGYTKQSAIVTSIAHAWCASKVDGKWMLYDPTWASGYVNKDTFFKKLNNSFYKVLPSKMILTHMPFDYLWQFLEEPISNNEFHSGILQKDKAKINYNFEAEIAKYETLQQDEKAFETAERVEKNGVINSLISEYLANKKQEFTALRQNKNVEKLNQIVADFNQSIVLLNDFILYRNKKFKPKLSDDDISAMIAIPYEKLKQCQNDLNKLGAVGKENLTMLSSLKKSVNDTFSQAEQHYNFVKKYISKNAIERKLMFTKLYN
jgi:Transglutaminase-like superfamily